MAYTLNLHIRKRSTGYSTLAQLPKNFCSTI